MEGDLLAAGRLDRLRSFLQQSAGQPFIWGERDCALWVARWIEQERGFDPAAEARGAYHTALGCHRYVARNGGLVALAGRLLAGFEPTTQPEPGDVGVVDAPMGETMAIRASAGWAMMGDRLIGIAPLPILKAWRV